MAIHKVSLNIEYQGRDCVATCNFYSKEDEVDTLALVDCCDDDCLPEINTPDWCVMEAAVDAAFDSFQSIDLMNHIDPHANMRNTHGEWIK